ncbi:MAG: POTRA domain-containing protein, partial [Gemmatimonadales bacterium]
MEGDVRSNVVNSLTLAEVPPDQPIDVARIRRLHEHAPDEIRRALQPFGYYRAKVQSELVTAGKPWVARYTIDLGPPLRVNRLEIRVIGEGRDEPLLVEAVSQFPLSEGDVLLQPLYTQGKATLQAPAAELGYFDAAFDTSQIRVDLDAYKSTIVLQFDTGARYRFGSVTFNQEILDSSVVWGYVPFRPDDYFSVAKLIELQNNLNESPYFSRAEVRPMPHEREAQRVPVHVDLAPQKAARYEVGLGYGTDTGPRATGSASLRRLNRSGHRAGLDARISSIERSLSGRYLVPQVFGSSGLLTFFAGFDYFAP